MHSDSHAAPDFYATSAQHMLVGMQRQEVQCTCAAGLHQVTKTQLAQWARVVWFRLCSAIATQVIVSVVLGGM